MSSTRGAKKRGRPPKVAVSDRTKKFQYHLMKKPKYLLNQSKGSDSQVSTPTVSRASSPQGSEGSRRSSTRIRGRDGRKAGRRGGIAGSQYQRRGYNPNAVDTHDSEYHYGSDFGDESSDNKSEAEDELPLSRSDSETSVVHDDPSSDSDFSLSSYSTTSCTPRRGNSTYTGRAPSPEPLWLQNIELPPLVLPRSSEDLLLPKEQIMQAISIYEVLRHFRNLVRLSPFRLEDFCAAVACEDQSNLFAEIHIMLLKAILREEDSQQTHFGPLDQKDSVNVSLFLIDYITWPEVLRLFVESDKHFDQEVLNILSTSEYPFTSVEDRLKVLKFLTDSFLITNPVREDLLNEVPIHYDDHCRVCHKLGDLLCCETCPAVFHLECVDPPLVDVPEEDWQCSICKSHKISGVVDCVLDAEKQGLLCRQENLGFDRHGRKYWFLARRIFVESEDGEVWYYSTATQLDLLLEVLDQNKMEASLCREIADFKDEIIRQMELTEKLTTQTKGNRKSYLDVENALILKERKDKLEQKQKVQEEEKEKERQTAEDMVAKMHDDCEEGKKTIETTETLTLTTTTTVEKTSNSVTVTSSNVTEVTTTTTVTASMSTGEKTDGAEPAETDESEADKGKDILTRSKTGSLTPRTFHNEEVKRRNTVISTSNSISREESLIQQQLEKFEAGSADTPSRMTRLKTSQIANGTYLFKLGMENFFKTYVNQYTTNIIALNKPQRNEERDKKRHLSHKFSLTSASEFKWIGALNGPRALLVNTLRQTILQMESSIPPPFMHPNWPLLRKPWVSAVGACINARDFARALIVLQACIKPVVFASVWHEQLGHVKLYRVTAAEREERKKIDKREKKEKEEEEERNRVTLNFVKYTLGLKHQVWKQKGEEYRVHGQWGWIWMAANRKMRSVDSSNLGLAAGPQKMMVQIRDGSNLKILAVDPNTYKYLTNTFAKDDEDVKNNDVDNDDNVDPTSDTSKTIKKDGDSLKNLRVVKQVSEFEELDITKALTTAGRLLFPKIAKRSRLDDFLNRRSHLRIMEERRVSLTPKSLTANAVDIKPTSEDVNVDVENDASEVDLNIGGLDKPTSGTSTLSREIMTTLTKKIQTLRIQYQSISKVGKDFQCYAKGCNSNSGSLGTTESSSCYSPMCLQKARVRKELLALLRRVNNQSSASSLKKLTNTVQSPVQTSILEQKLTDSTSANTLSQDKIDAAIRKNLETAVAAATACTEDSLKDTDIFIPKKPEEPKPEIKTENEIKVEQAENENNSNMEIDPVGEVKEEVNSPVSKKLKKENSLDESQNEEIKSEEKTVVSVKKVSTRSSARQSIRGGDGVGKQATTSHSHKESYSVSSTVNGATRTIQTLNAKSTLSMYRAHENRRFPLTRKATRREPSEVKVELAPDGSQRIYSGINTTGKVYLKKVTINVIDKRKKRTPVKYPLCSTFQSKRGQRTLLVLPQHEARKLARKAGRFQVSGFHHMAKANQSVWPYPCPRPLFKTCWLYRTVGLKSLAAAALQLKILWACLRWDDMQMKPITTDGKHQITTETEIISLEMLKHRHVGQFLERTQYLRRKVVIPLELPKTIREVTSIRSGLRKRKRPESPQTTEPQVTEEWVEEDKLELWEIKLYGERLERANAQVITRSRTGNLPPNRAITEAGGTPGGIGANKDSITVSNKATSEEIKEKMEQQLRMQRLAHQQKRALELKNQSSPIVKVVTSTMTPNVGKSTLTSLLTSNTNAITGNKTLIGTRRIIMTKDGTPRVIATPSNILPKGGTGNQSIIKVQTPGGSTVQTIQVQGHGSTSSGLSQNTLKTESVPQRVQIIRNPDGKIQVRGLMPGQQLVQMSDGKLHVLSSNQINNIVSPANKSTTKSITNTATTISTTPNSKLVSTPLNTNSQLKMAMSQSPKPGMQQVVVRQQQQVPSGTPVLQKVLNQAPTPQLATPTNNTSLLQNNSGTPQVISTGGNQYIVSNQEIAQQLSAGKLQLATVNGQQVLIRPSGVNQATIVAYVSQPQTQVQNQTTVVTSNVVQTPTPQPAPKPVAPPVVENTTPQATNASIEQQNVEESLLANQPPGTVIKCVTAQVIQTNQGPRIVLQGLQGTDFTPEQLTLVQQQVKQQLLQAQASTGKQGILGPTKIYLAVQPAVVNKPGEVTANEVTNRATSSPSITTPTVLNKQASGGNVNQLQPPPLTPVQTQQVVVRQSTLVANKAKVAAGAPGVVTPNSSQQISASGPTRILVNGQKILAPISKIDSISSITTSVTNTTAQSSPTVLSPTSNVSEEQSAKSSNKFVITPEYIQHTIKNALKQENLNPEIEEKLLQLQRYQEKQMKSEPDTAPVSSHRIAPQQSHHTSNVSRTPTVARKRPPSMSKNHDDDEWIETPKRKPPSRSNVVQNQSSVQPVIHQEPKVKEEIKSETDDEISPTIQNSKNRPIKIVDDKRKQAARYKNQVVLFRQKEALKKEILKKRANLEKELQIDIQKELSVELASRTKAERSKQEEVRTGINKRKTLATTPTKLTPQNMKPSGRPKKHKSPSSSMGSPPGSGGSRGGNRKEKLYCLCQTPYDETKFYVGCDLCNNWFHGECVEITEEMSKTLTEFVCTECRHARDTQELYCLCKQPYDESQFYICCDRCQDWFHGRCVGILQSEADNIDEYICPNCQRNSSVNFANMKDLQQRDFDGLRKLIKQIQSHKSAWPFLEPVDPNEAPDYYKVIKDPMDLQTIENKINDRQYTKLSDFIGDMTKIFDNCRYYNPKESQFFKCAEALELYFVNKIKNLREKLFETQI